MVEVAFCRFDDGHVDVKMDESDDKQRKRRIWNIGR